MYDFRTCDGAITNGKGIWCSVFPFIAGIFGIVAGKNAKNQAKISLVMGFSIVGAIFSCLLVIIQPILLAYNLIFNHVGFLVVQIIISIVAFVNFILLIITASYSCCLSNSCCKNGNSVQAPQVVYVPYPNQQSTTIVPGFHQQPCYSQ